MKKKVIEEKKNRKILARKRIEKLFLMAEQNAMSGKLTLANRYVEIARKISMRYKVLIPDEFKQCFCKHCYSYLLPCSTCRVRIHRSTIVTYCYKCKKYSRIPIRNNT